MDEEFHIEVVEAVDASDVVDPDKTQKIKPISRIRKLQILEAVRPHVSGDDVEAIDDMIKTIAKGVA